MFDVPQILSSSWKLLKSREEIHDFFQSAPWIAKTRPSLPEIASCYFNYKNHSRLANSIIFAKCTDQQELSEGDVLFVGAQGYLKLSTFILIRVPKFENGRGRHRNIWDNSGAILLLHHQLPYCFEFGRKKVRAEYKSATKVKFTMTARTVFQRWFMA